MRDSRLGLRPRQLSRDRNLELIIKLFNRNTSGSLGEREIMWEHETQASVSRAFSSSLKLSRVFLSLDRNAENMFSTSFRKHRDEKKGNILFTLIIKCKFSLLAHYYVNSSCYFSVYIKL